MSDEDKKVEETPEFDGVIVVKHEDEQGNIRTEVVPHGKVQATEVQTLLELGVQGWRRVIGLIG